MPAKIAAMASPVRNTNDLTSPSAGVQRTVAITTPASRITAATATRTHSDSSATVYTATSREASASNGPLTSHCTNATAAMTRNTVIGARRRKTRGKLSAATISRFGDAPGGVKKAPEHSTNSAAASATSTGPP